MLGVPRRGGIPGTFDAVGCSGLYWAYRCRIAIKSKFAICEAKSANVLYISSGSAGGSFLDCGAGLRAEEVASACTALSSSVNFSMVFVMNDAKKPFGKGVERSSSSSSSSVLLLLFAATTTTIGRIY